MFGKCKVCAEKDRRIHDLKAQGEMLYRMANPSAITGNLPVVSVEANTVMDGSHDASASEAAKEQEEIAAEANRLLSGNY